MKKVRVLFVDDSEDDVLLIKRHLKKAGFEVESTRADSRETLEKALRDPWDAILCDYSMPKFSTSEALSMVQGKGLDIPFLVISGAVGEETAVSCMREGAHDFILKDSLARLVPALEREIQEAKGRKEKRETEAQLRQTEGALTRAEKLRALGQMAAGVSHDLKNILHPLSLHLEVIERSILKKNYEMVPDSIKEIRHVLARGLQSIERLRNYSRQAPESRAETVRLEKIAEEAMGLAMPEAHSRKNLELSADLKPTAAILGHPADLISSVLNLIVNAMEALKDQKGKITVRTGETPDVVWIEVEDNGPGISKETEAHIFEPFFTTKGAEGTGLGLAMVYACSKRHKGRVDLASEPGKGAKFRLSIPRDPE